MGSRGNRDDTQGKPHDNEHGRPLSMLVRRATGKIWDNGEKAPLCRMGLVGDRVAPD